MPSFRLFARVKLRCSWLNSHFPGSCGFSCAPGETACLRGLNAFFFQGLYCVSVNCMDNAEAQFTTALRVRCLPSLHGAGGASP